MVFILYVYTIIMASRVIVLVCDLPSQPCVQSYQAQCRLSSGPYFFVPLLFSENALLSLLFGRNTFEVTKNCNFFSSLASPL